jgi:nucleotide-binding universal stress UspA family protein
MKGEVMIDLRTILHPTDFSDRSTNALYMACALARDYSARLVVLHVGERGVVYTDGYLPVTQEDIFAEDRHQLAQLEIPDNSIQVERRFEEGTPAQQILNVAAEVDADLIVMGTHGRTGLSRWLLGSVAEQVMRKAPCPVVTTTSPIHLRTTAKAKAWETSADEDERARDMVEEASMESFPAGAPPAWSAHPH